MDEIDTLSPSDRMRAHAIADRVAENLEKTHGISFSDIADAVAYYKAEKARKEKYASAVGLTLIGLAIAAAWAGAVEIIRFWLANVGKS